MIWIPISGQVPKLADRYLAPRRELADTSAAALPIEERWGFAGAAAEYGVRSALLRELERSYPGVDVMRRLSELRLWSRNHAAKRRTYEGMATWLGKRCGDTQDHQPTERGSPPARAPSPEAQRRARGGDTPGRSAALAEVDRRSRFDSGWNGDDEEETSHAAGQTDPAAQAASGRTSTLP